MILSMTGFGTYSLSKNGITVKCEVLCLNKKNMEIQINLPRYALCSDIDLRKVTGKTLMRGKVTINYDIQIQTGNKAVVLDDKLLKSWVNELKKLKASYNLNDDMTTSKWLDATPIWNIQDKSVDSKTLKFLLMETLNKSLSRLIKMRKDEGKNIQKDLTERLQKLNKNLLSIEKRVPLVKENYSKKIKKGINNSKNLTTIESDIFNRFIGAFSEKADISEEITRLKSHIGQFGSFLKSKEPVGRSLDFLLQEFLRETNTIGSKAGDIIISKNVVDIKTLLEQIREQVQNIL